MIDGFCELITRVCHHSVGILSNDRSATHLAPWDFSRKNSICSFKEYRRMALINVPLSSNRHLEIRIVRRLSIFQRRKSRVKLQCAHLSYRNSTVEYLQKHLKDRFLPKEQTKYDISINIQTFKAKRMSDSNKLLKVKFLLTSS